jgi:hypothetical protein
MVYLGMELEQLGVILLARVLELQNQTLAKELMVQLALVDLLE